MNNTAIISGSSHPKLASDIATYLNMELTPVILSRFKNTEVRFKVEKNIRNKDVFIVQTGSFGDNYSINDIIIETIIMINACRCSSCGKITLIMPFYPYCRGDKKDDARTPISSRAIADILDVDRIVTIELHSAQQQGFFGKLRPIPVDNIYTFHLIKPFFRGIHNLNNMVVISPDEGGIKRALKLAEILEIPNYEFCHKKRDFDKPGVVCDIQLLGISELKNKTAIICDDIIDSGGTLLKCINLLVKNGVKNVFVVVTHGIFTCNSAEKIEKNPYITKCFVTNSLPQDKNCNYSKFVIVDIHKVMGEVIKRLNTGESISDMKCFTNNSNLKKIEKEFKNFEKKLNL